MMNKPPLAGGETLFIQGATVPLEMAGTAFNKNAPPADSDRPAEEPEETTKTETE
jgi:hypothetical protein